MSNKATPEDVIEKAQELLLLLGELKGINNKIADTQFYANAIEMCKLAMSESIKSEKEEKTVV